MVHLVYTRPVSADEMPERGGYVSPRLESAFCALLGSLVGNFGIMLGVELFCGGAGVILDRRYVRAMTKTILQNKDVNMGSSR